MKNLKVFGRGFAVGLCVLSAASGAVARTRTLGKIESKPECSNKPAEVFVLKGDALVYQFSVPSHGDFEIHLVPGNYSLRAATPNSCFAETSIEGGQPEVTLHLAPKKNEVAKLGAKNPARAPTAYPYDGAMDTVGGFQGGGFQGAGGAMGFMPQGQGMDFSMPWWAMMQQSGQMPGGAFAQSPCMWQMQGQMPGYGCQSSAYPYAFNTQVPQFGAAKPNVYFTGKNQHVELTLNASLAPVLVAVPALKDQTLKDQAPKQQEWAFDLVKNEANYKGQHYPYLFYDARVVGAHFQADSGFCGPREDVLQKMTDGLVALKFPKVAVQDFAGYWAVKMPAGTRFCVYPQEAKQLDTDMPLNLKGKSESYGRTRMLWVVIPQSEALRKAASVGAFNQPPQKLWSAKPEIVNPDLHVYEWGVGFLFQ